MLNLFSTRCLEPSSFDQLLPSSLLLLLICNCPAFIHHPSSFISIYFLSILFYFQFFLCLFFFSSPLSHLVLNQFLNVDGGFMIRFSGVPKPGQQQSIFSFSDHLQNICSVHCFLILISSAAIHRVYSVNWFNIRAVLFPPSWRSSVMLFSFPAYSRAWKIKHEYLSDLSHSSWMWNVLPINAFTWK